ncbi:hypothetical protein AAFF_G00077260 [Aldrovandia affinis]|uniref:T-complex protein 11-like protein 2 n=1 Tax=Aldrovandia affinis TaxID=143900 RepID=A0AAD7RY60_9TELE|nr:hypothetical protein AAFF_G00077260 [Aldrovandia affinis]
MPLNNERPTPTAKREDQSSDTESSDRCDSMTSSDSECFRQSFTSDSSSKHSSPSSSPPKTITLDEVMASARDLSNLSLAHEIVVNPNFNLEKPDLPQNSLERRVKDIVHKVFWDCLESELNDDPPVYQHALKLLEEIREILISFLNPGSNRLRTQINEVLDMELIRQQADNNSVHIQGLADYIITVMGKLCAPIRDDEVKRLKETSLNIASMFKEIFRVLDLMKMDMVNFTIKTLRPELQRQSVEYERAVFQNIVEKIPNALEHTTNWIKGCVEELLLSLPPGPDKNVRDLPSPMLMINTSYIKLLSWDYQTHPLPETLMTDEGRLRELQRDLQLLQTVAAVLLIVHSAMGGPVSDLPALSERLKKMTSVLLEGMHSPSFKLTEALENVSTQICVELNKSLTERNYPALPPDLQVTLRGQICTITEENNPVRSLIEGRVQLYFKSFLAMPSSHMTPPPTPGGLALIQPELGALGASFVSIVNFNKQVYTPFYMGILKSLLFNDTPGPPPSETADAQATSQ